MNDIKDLLHEWGLNAYAALAGLIGGFIAITMDEKQVSFRSALTQVASALAFSGYGTEWLAKWWNLENNPSTCGLLGLCLGICGLYLSRGVLKVGKKFSKNPINFIKKGGDNDVADN